MALAHEKSLVNPIGRDPQIAGATRPLKVLPNVVASPIDAFRSQAQDRIGGGNPAKIELGALLLWERSLASTAPTAQAYTPKAGALTGYLTALGHCLGHGQGALAPAILEAARDLRPELLLKEQPSNGYTYLGGDLSSQDQWQVQQQVENGPTYCHGVRCAGLWNDQEESALRPVLSKLQERAPALYSQLKGVTVQTWLGSSEPSWNVAPHAQGTYWSDSPGMLKLDRSIFNAPERLEEVVFHEFGHVIDAHSAGGFKSQSAASFVATQRPASCVSAYAITAREEDFAETFSFAIKNYDKIHSHPDLYFHGLGDLSAKFIYVFKNVLKEEIPQPSAAWTAMKQQLKAGDSPFGWVSADGKIEQTNQELRPVLREIALQWDLDNPAKNLQYVSAGRRRDQLEFVAENLLGFQPESRTQGPARPLSREQIAQDLKQYKTLADLHAQKSAQLEPVEAQCQAFVDQATPASEIPPELTDWTGFLFGQRAMDIHSFIDNLPLTPEPEWKEKCLAELNDKTIHQILLQSDLPATVIKSALEARQDDLLNRYSELKKRADDEKVPQTRQLLQDQKLEIGFGLQRIKGELANLIEVGDVHLCKHMSQYFEQTGQPQLLDLYKQLQPSAK